MDEHIHDVAHLFFGAHVAGAGDRGPIRRSGRQYDARIAHAPGYLSPMPEVPPAPQTADRRSTRPSATTRRRVTALIITLHRWAESGWSRSAVFAWAFINGAVVPGPSDALLIPLGLADPRCAYPLAGWTTLGSVLGGLVAYAIGALAFTQLGTPLLGFLGVTPHGLEKMHALFAAKGWMVVVLGSLPLASPKIVSIAAGGFGVPLWHFVLALSAVRFVRFMIEATIIYFAGSGILRWVERKLGRPLIASR